MTSVFPNNPDSDFPDYSEARLPAYEALDVWEQDQNLKRQMEMRLGQQTMAWALPTLRHMGKICGGPVFEKAQVVDKENHRLEKWDRWGNEINQVRHHPLYLENVEALYGSGIVGWNYLKENQDAGRLAPFTLTAAWGYMAGGADIGVACPVCMTHGVVYLLEKFGSEALQKRFIPSLVSTDPSQLHTGGMLLTEITGGSDVGASKTVARRMESGDEGPGMQKWLLTGDKWFTSNAGGDQFMVLARPEGFPGGTKGLGLFLMPAKLADGSPNRIKIRRIKDKIGTRNVATGEMELRDAEAWCVGEVQDGIHYMLDMVNLSRLYNALASIGLMGRCFLESRRHAKGRSAFGKQLDEHPAMKNTLVGMALELRANVALTFEASETFEKVLKGDESLWPLLRILTPMCKYRTGERACDFARETLVVFGGNGTIEDFGVERLYRDAIILPIWEGTANIQALDILRAIAKEKSHEALMAVMSSKLKTVQSEPGCLLRSALEKEQMVLMSLLESWLTSPKDEVLLGAREGADALITWTQAVCLVAEAEWELEHGGDAGKFLAAGRFIQTKVLGRGGIKEKDRFVLDYFRVIVDFEPMQEQAATQALSTMI